MVEYWKHQDVPFFVEGGGGGGGGKRYFSFSER